MRLRRLDLIADRPRADPGHDIGDGIDPHRLHDLFQRSWIKARVSRGAYRGVRHRDDARDVDAPGPRRAPPRQDGGQPRRARVSFVRP